MTLLLAIQRQSQSGSALVHKSMSETVESKYSIRSVALDECPSLLECRYNSENFRDWTALKEHLIKVYGIEDVVIGLQADYVRSESVDRLDAIEITEFSNDSVLLAMSVGRRVSVAVHLVATEQQAKSGEQWRPKADYRSILSCAKGVYCRGVRDRVVELMSAREGRGVVSLFINSEGRIISASGKASKFCEDNFSGNERVYGYLPHDQWHFVQGALKRQRESKNLFYKEESLVFSFFEDVGVVDCLLQGMGESGYLLCLSLEPKRFAPSGGVTFS